MRVLIRFTKVYTLWLISTIITLVAAYLLVQVIIDIAFIIKVNPWQLRAVRNFGFVIIGLGWLVFIIGLEGYFRKYLALNSQLHPIGYLFVIEIALLLLLFLADTLIL